MEWIIMRGQFVFEFLVAGIIFFIMVVYAINYLNMNVSDFGGKFYRNRLYSKAIQVSQVLMSGKSSLSMGEGWEFNASRIRVFNETYCTPYGYKNLTRDLYLYETNEYGIFPNDVKIVLSNATDIILDCGMRIPRNITKAEVTRVGLLEGETAKLTVIVW